MTAMKARLYHLPFLTSLLALVTFAAHSQTSAVHKNIIVVIADNTLRTAKRANFDMDGATANGLTEKQLNEKFRAVQSSATVLNFLAQAGYKSIGFSTVANGTGVGTGGGLRGFAILMEKVE